MPRTTVAPENVIGGGDELYQQLKLKVGERSRIWLVPELGQTPLRHQPWREWVHELKAPVIQDGVGKKTTRERQDGSTFEDWETTFIGRPICLGDFGLLAEKGVDPDNCPSCEAAIRLGKTIFKPKVRYASAVVKFAVQSGGWEVMQPFSAGLFVWSYPATRYKALTEIVKAEGRDLCEYDLRLGPCEKPESFQKYEIAALGSRPPAWKSAQQYMVELLTTPGNMPTDEQLQALCGRTTEAAFMREDIKRAESLWAMAEGSSTAQAATLGAEIGAAGGAANLTGGLQDLMNAAGGSEPPASAPAAPAPAPVVSEQQAAEAALVGAAQAGVAEGTVTPETATGLENLLGGGSTAMPPPAAPAAESQGETVSLQDLLGGG